MPSSASIHCQSQSWFKVKSSVFNKYIDTIGQLLPRHIKKFPGLTIKDWTANVNAAMNYARMRPKRVIGWLSKRFGLSAAQQESYFAHTLELLSQYNVK